MKKVKVLTIILLIGCFFLLLTQIASADSSFIFEPEAWQLNRLGLFAGASTYTFNPDLGAKLDRQIGIILLLNFFGKSPDVRGLSDYETDRILQKYNDNTLISSWARPYMAFAVKTGMIVGTSETTLGPTDPLDGLSFAAMILRELGYTVTRENFSDSIYILYLKGGLNPSETALFNKDQLFKDDAVGMAYTTLFARCADGYTLIEKLIDSGAVSVDTAVLFNLVRYYEPGEIEPNIPEHRIIKRPSAYDLVYYQILEAMLNASPMVKLQINEYTDTPQEVFVIVSDCIWDNPEVLYYSGCTYSSNGLLTLKYSKGIDVIKEHSALLEEKVDKILKQLIKPGMSDYEKELAVHDYIAEHCDYDLAAHRNQRIAEESYNAYGALCVGTAVCEGYAEAASMLLNRAGVRCEIITGTSKGYGHAWNIVNIDGENYHLDITWDDPVMSDGRKVINYHYFNLSDSEISLDHDWDRTKYKACTANDYEYYAYNNLTVKDQSEFINQVIDSVQQGNNDISLKVRNFRANGFNFNYAVRTIVNILGRSCSCLFNDDLGIADLVFY